MSAYARVRKIIETNALDSRKPLYSQWFVQTEASVEQWVDLLRPVLDDDDHLFVTQVRRPYQGYLSKSLWPWLRTRI